MITNHFAGTWKLVTAEFVDSHENTVYPYGKGAAGILIYDRAGTVSVQIMRAGRPAFASGDLQRGSAEEIQAAAAGVMSYFGTFDVNEQEGIVIHHIQASLFPNWIGGDQKRRYEFSGNLLTLSTPPLLIDGVTMKGRLVWERTV